MFDSKSPSAIGKPGALIGAARLSLLASVSGGLAPSMGNRATAAVLSQALGLQSLGGAHCTI
jgi:hypothetical protein